LLVEPLLGGSRCHSASSRCDTAIGVEQPIPEEIDHREVVIPVAMVYEMELLLLPEPRKAAKPRSSYMILTVDVVMPTV
jgi:hypothetical protein